MNRKDNFIPKIKFCIECGDELEDFSLSDDSDINNTKERFHVCQNSGKFNGDMCSRIFISSFDMNNSFNDLENLDFPPDE